MFPVKVWPVVLLINLDCASIHAKYPSLYLLLIKGPNFFTIHFDDSAKPLNSISVVQQTNWIHACYTLLLETVQKACYIFDLSYKSMTLDYGKVKAIWFV